MSNVISFKYDDVKDRNFNIAYVKHVEYYYNLIKKEGTDIFLKDVIKTLGLDFGSLNPLYKLVYNQNELIDFGVSDQDVIDYINGKKDHVILTFNITI